MFIQQGRDVDCIVAASKYNAHKSVSSGRSCQVFHPLTVCGNDVFPSQNNFTFNITRNRGSDLFKSQFIEWNSPPMFT